MGHRDGDDGWSGSADTTFSGHDGEPRGRLSAVPPRGGRFSRGSCVCDDVRDILPAGRADLGDDGGVCVCRCASLFAFVGLPYFMLLGVAGVLVWNAVRRRHVFENNVKSRLDFGRCKPFLGLTPEGEGPEQ